MKAGERYYIVAHPYYHFLVEVAEVTGKKEIVCKRCVRVNRCARDFTEFFKDGCGKDTDFTVWPERTEISGWMFASPWSHEIPK